MHLAAAEAVIPPIRLVLFLGSLLCVSQNPAISKPCAEDQVAEMEVLLQQPQAQSLRLLGLYKYTVTKLHSAIQAPPKDPVKLLLYSTCLDFAC